LQRIYSIAEFVLGLEFQVKGARLQVSRSVKKPVTRDELMMLPRSYSFMPDSPDQTRNLDGNPIIQLRGLHKQFGELHVIQSLDLVVKHGERHALIGPNGAGKSTLFALISGLIQPTAGEILLGGENVVGVAPHLINRKGLGRSFQITNIFANLSVLENIRIGIMGSHGIRFGLNRLIRQMTTINEQAMALIEAVQLKSKAHVSAGILSYSEQRALEIGLTLTTNPAVILLDEPTAGMSKDEAQRMIELIAKVTEGRTLLMVEHDMDVVFGLCDRISVLVYGNILASGDPETIRASVKVREAYLGEGFA
jgi:branched-chain amino acid transport system ATP-binding protein